MAKWKFTYFKASGKYYTADTGEMTEEIFNLWARADDRRLTAFREALCAANGGHLPGLSGTQTDLVMIAEEVDDVPWGWPIMLTEGRLLTA